MHGSGDNQLNVQKSKIQSYSVEHCTFSETDEGCTKRSWIAKCGFFLLELCTMKTRSTFVCETGRKATKVGG